MEKDIIAILSGSSAHFSRRQRAVADYICEHPDMAAFMTAELLAASVGVSESTVVRFALELGFNGYPDMRRSVQQLLRSKISPNTHSGTEEPEKDYTVQFKCTVENYSRAVAALAEGDNPLRFDAAVKQLQKAGRVFILGESGGEAAAHYLWQGLNLSRDGVLLVKGDPYEQMLHIGAGDALLYICPAGALSLGAARYAHDSGAAVIVMAADDVLNDAAFADSFLFCGKNPAAGDELSLTAYAAAGAMLSVFAEEAKGAAKKTEKIRQEYEKNDHR